VSSTTFHTYGAKTPVADASRHVPVGAFIATSDHTALDNSSVDGMTL
jgi:hypothetical protein